MIQQKADLADWKKICRRVVMIVMSVIVELMMVFVIVVVVMVDQEKILPTEYFDWLD